MSVRECWTSRPRWAPGQHVPCPCGLRGALGQNVLCPFGFRGGPCLNVPCPVGLRGAPCLNVPCPFGVPGAPSANVILLFKGYRGMCWWGQNGPRCAYMDSLMMHIPIIPILLRWHVPAQFPYCPYDLLTTHFVAKPPNFRFLRKTF